jgi:hypothetical protein
MKRLIWVPGLFWLFPFWLYSDPAAIRQSKSICYIHGLWTGLQLLGLIVLAIACG